MPAKDTIKSLRKKHYRFYWKQGSIYCKAVRDNVVFGNYGWKHLAYHSNGRKRKVNDAKLRLNLLPWVPVVVKNCVTTRRVTAQWQPFKGKQVEVNYHELMHTIKQRGRPDKDVVVVLRRIGKNKMHYWTVRYDKKQKSP